MFCIDFTKQLSMAFFIHEKTLVAANSYKQVAIFWWFLKKVLATNSAYIIHNDFGTLKISYFSHNGLLLHCMHKQQDIFGCLAEILGCLGLREAANLEI